MLVEPELAVRYGVSKTPIREALQLLVREGWVTVLPRRGYQITPLSLSDVREVFALRHMVEPELAAQAAKRRNNVQLAALAELVEQLVHGNIERTLENAKAFHLLVAEMAGNGRAVTLLSGLLDEERRLHYLLPHLEDHLQTGADAQEHRQLVEAFVLQDPIKASEVMRAHLRDANTAIIAAFVGMSD
jgi:DNA-binding GntR family transcriptional regulator